MSLFQKRRCLVIEMALRNEAAAWERPVPWQKRRETTLCNIRLKVANPGKWRAGGESWKNQRKYRAFAPSSPQNQTTLFRHHRMAVFTPEDEDFGYENSPCRTKTFTSVSLRCFGSLSVSKDRVNSPSIDDYALTGTSRNWSRLKVECCF